MIATSEVLYTGEEWPFVSLPDFERRMENARIGTQGTLIMFVPLFEKLLKQSWEGYAQNHSSWIQEGLAFHGHTDTDPGPVPLFIHDMPQANQDISSTLENQFAVVW